MGQQTLAQLVRAKYPGAYDDLTDQQLESAVTKKFPGAYDDIPKTAAAPSEPQGPEGSAAGRFLSNFGEQVNPVAIAQGLYQAVRHPIDTAGNIISAQVDQGRQAVDMFQQGRYSEAAGHAGAAALPLFGPAAAAAGEQIASGDIAGGLGKGAGIIGTVLAPAAVRGVKRVAAALPESAAAALESGAASRIVDVMSPKVGANKVRLGNQAAKVAPALAKDLAEDGAPLSRSGLHAQVESKLSDAEQSLDAASDARLAAKTFATKPLIDSLMEKRAQFTSQAVEGSRPIRAAGQGASLESVPLGEDVVPGPNAARVAVIDQAIAELRKLGPVTRYDPIKVMRQAYDGPAKVVYSPAVTADYLTARGKALGAADVTGTLREGLAKWDPETATANAEYSLYRTADDVMSAAAETERVRPKVGRQIIARMSATLLGQHAAGTAGAIAGYVGGPLVDSALSSGVTTQLKTAALMQKLATAIRAGDQARVYTITAQLKAAAKAAATVGSGAVGRATSPSEPQTQTIGSGL